MKRAKWIVAALLLGAPLAFAHYFIIAPYVDPAPVVGVPVLGAPVTSAPVLGAPTTTVQWACVTSAGVVSGALQTTQASAETVCGAAVAADGVTRFLEERSTVTRTSTTTTTTPTTITSRNKRFELRGGTTLRVSDANAAFIITVGESGGTLPTAEASSCTDLIDPYDADIDFAWNCPNAPTTTNTVAVDTYAEWASCVATNGNLCNIAVGDYTGNLTSWGTDVKVAAHDDARLIGDVTLSSDDDVSWTGGKIKTDQLLIANSTDIEFSNVVFEFTGTGVGIELGPSLSNNVNERIAFIDVTTGTVEDDCTWAIHSGIGGNTLNDLTIANGRIDGCTSGSGPQTIRLNSETTNRLIIVDSIFNESQITEYGIRFGQLNDTFIKNVINMHYFFCNFTGGPITDCSLGGMEIDNADVYSENMIFLLGVGDTIGLVKNSRLHKSNGGSPVFNPGDLTDGGGNTATSWDGLSASIDFTRMPGKTSVASYGADH